MTVSISGQVPAEAQNGFYAIEEDWTEERTPDTVVAVVLVDRAKLHFDDSKQEWSATMKFRHIEPLVSEADAVKARDLLEKACAARGGKVFTPDEPDTELDIPEAVEPDLDLETPLEEQADADAGNVTEGPWEPSVEEPTGGDAA